MVKTEQKEEVGEEVEVDGEDEGEIPSFPSFFFDIISRRIVESQATFICSSGSPATSI